ncbi:MAG: hypothetical protein SGJ05_01495 [bacterium]|nr:hypothetical protein [bacterium]
MQLLLSILLYLGCISAPNSYQLPQVNTYANQHQAFINSVYTTPPLQDYIVQQYGAAATTIEVIDPFK